MSLATDGDYDDDLGHGYLRRPISVTELLEREGYRPAARSRATRRALTGVAAGAVLALGAVVGSLLLNHATGSTAGDTLASGSSGDIVLNHGHSPAVVAPAAKSQPATNGTTTSSNSAQPKVTQGGGRGVSSHPVVVVPVQKPVTAPVTTQSTQSAPTAPTSTSTLSSTAPATGGTPSTSTSTTAPATSTPATSTTSPSTGTSSSTSNGGLLGAVTGTLTGTLDSVTQPVFNWFG